MLTDDQKRDRLQKALLWSGPTHTIEDVLAQHEKGQLAIWARGDGIIVTEHVNYPQLKACNYFLVAGALGDCLAMQGEIEQLPPAQRSVVTLRDVQEFTAEEACEALGITEANQRVLLHRGRSKLRRALEVRFEKRRAAV